VAITGPRSDSICWFVLSPLSSFDGKIIIEWVLEKSSMEGMDLIHLAAGRDQWRAVVNTVMNLRVP
jgi:hypothetical protein